MTVSERCEACRVRLALAKRLATDVLPSSQRQLWRSNDPVCPASNHWLSIWLHSRLQESFSGLFEKYNGDDSDNDSDSDDDEYDDSDDPHYGGNDCELPTNKYEMSYTVEQFSDIRELDPEWDDADIEEVMVLSPKQRHSKLPTISEEYNTLSLAAHLDCSESLPQTITSTEFEILPTSGGPIHCRKRSTNKLYVVKALNPGMHEKAVMDAIRGLCAPFVERLHWILPGFTDDEVGSVYVVLDSSYSDSLDAVVKSKSLSPADVLFYACEVADAISSLKAASIIHRDLAPSNIFVDDAGHIVLSNFRNATMFSTATMCCMPPPNAAIAYQAPEIVLGWAHDFASAFFRCSANAKFHELQNPLKDSIPDRSQILDVNLSDALPPQPKDLIKKCLERNPALRLPIEGIKDHHYFATVYSSNFSRSDWLNVREKNILQTASKAIPSQPRLQRVDVVNDITKPPIRSFRSMDDIRAQMHAKRFSLNVPSNSARMWHHRPSHSTGTSSLPLADPMAIDPLPTFPSRLSLQIQTPDMLPTIFRPTPLDGRLVKEQEPAQPSPVDSSPTVCEVSPRERMAQFWERLDEEEEQQHIVPSASSFELRDALMLALPCPPLPQPRPRRKLRECTSSAALRRSHSNHRFSVFSATDVTTNKLRKLRRPLSTPFLSKPILDLPSGVEQIGKGIGFTYKMPAASQSKASICTASASSAAGRLLRNGLGLGKRILRRVKSSPRFSSPLGLAQRRACEPPARIQTGLAQTPSMHSPVSDGPLTPDSIAFPPLPEIVDDPFAKDEVEAVRFGEAYTTLRLVPISPALSPIMDNIVLDRNM
ncbi:hypothetical protein GGX14DRAFT_609050 [Mycena pura]|uniref:Protein kinase domain-containing protein n=1 Tax=Mycena pura TaxID=153505 RepID=A0AAD6Y128_9AGAR|nr:hypothetical protein GGX14DRAFT_609050 [Mycena pura]